MRDHHQRCILIKIAMEIAPDPGVIFRIKELKWFIQQKEFAAVEERVYQENHL